MKKKKSVLVSGLLLLVLVIGGLLAYFTDTDTATNIFTIGDDVDISLTEEDWENSPGITIWTNLNAEDIFSGEEIESSPQINNESSTKSSTTPVYISVTVDPDLTAEQAETLSDSPNIIINAYGIQTDSLSTSDPAEIFALF